MLTVPHGSGVGFWHFKMKKKNMQEFYGLQINKVEKNVRGNTVVGQPEKYVDSFFWIWSLLACD